MKNLSVILNIVLIVALGILFFLHFNLRSKLNVTPTFSSGGSVANGKIVYVDIDTLIDKYKGTAEMRNQLEEKQRKMDAELKSKGANWQKGVDDYQQKAQKGLITHAKAAEIEQQLGAEQQKLYNLRDQLANELAEEQQVMNRNIINDIEVYLKEYNKTKGYQFILGHTFGSTLLYVPDSLNITSDVLKGLNEQYQSKKK